MEKANQNPCQVREFQPCAEYDCGSWRALGCSMESDMTLRSFPARWSSDQRPNDVFSRIAVSLLLLIGLSFGSSAQAQPSSIPALARTTVLTGSQTGAARVRLDEMATIANPSVSKASVRVSGPGPFAGFALVATDVPNREGFVLLGGRLANSGQRKVFLDVAGDWVAPQGQETFILQPGDYLIYLLPGSGTTTVKLTFEGLEGALTLTPLAEAHYALKSPLPYFAETPTKTYYAIGSTNYLGGRGLIYGATWFKTDVHIATSSKACFWRNEPAYPVGYLPTCGDLLLVQPGNFWSSDQWADPTPSIGPVSKFYSGSWHPFSAGFKGRLRYGLSITVQSASAVEEVGSVGLWITYADTRALDHP